MSPPFGLSVETGFGQQNEAEVIMCQSQAQALRLVVCTCSPSAPLPSPWEARGGLAALGGGGGGWYVMEKLTDTLFHRSQTLGVTKLNRYNSTLVSSKTCVFMSKVNHERFRPMQFVQSPSAPTERMLSPNRTLWLRPGADMPKQCWKPRWQLF